MTEQQIYDRKRISLSVTTVLPRGIPTRPTNSQGTTRP